MEPIENSDPKVRDSRKNLAVLASSGAVNTLGGGIISGYVSLYFISLGGNPITLGARAVKEPPKTSVT